MEAGSAWPETKAGRLVEELDAVADADVPVGEDVCAEAGERRERSFAHDPNGQPEVKKWSLPDPELPRQ